MKKPVTFMCCVALLCTLPVQASGQPAPSFFPQAVGDYWLYFDYGWGGSVPWDTITVSVVQDSIIGGRHYFMSVGHSPHYGNTWTSFSRIDPTGDVFSVNPITGAEGLAYRLSDTSHTWWDSQLRRFDSCVVVPLFGTPRACLYVGTYSTSGGDTVVESHSILIDKIGFYMTIPYAIIDGGPTILAGGKVGGVSFGIVAGVKPHAGTHPRDIMLDRPFPNPFNPSTTVRYSISVRCHVTLEITDLIGNRIAKLLDGAQEPGVHTVEWNGSGRASGMYLCRLRAGGAIQTQRLLLLR